MAFTLCRNEISGCSGCRAVIPDSGDNLFRAWFKQVWISVEAMMTVGSFVICPFYWHQESVFIEQVKQAVSPDIQPFSTCSTTEPPRVSWRVFYL